MGNFMRFCCNHFFDTTFGFFISIHLPDRTFHIIWKWKNELFSGICIFSFYITDSVLFAKIIFIKRYNSLVYSCFWCFYFSFFHFFFDRINKGTYALEYDIRVNNLGDFSNGISTIESMYAPEYSSHTKGIRVNVKK